MRSSKKTIVISSIGLIFSLGLIASTLIYVDSSRELIFRQVFENKFERDDVVYNLNVPLGDSITPASAQHIINQSIEQAIESIGFQNRLTNLTFNTALESTYANLTVNETFSYEGKQDSYIRPDFTPVFVIEISDKIKPELNQIERSGSQFPTTSNEVYLLHVTDEDEFYSTKVENSINSEIVYKTSWESQTENQTLVLTGMATTNRDNIYTKWTPSGIILEPRYSNLAELLSRRGGEFIFIVNNLTNFIENLVFTQGRNIFDGPRLNIYGTMDYDILTIDLLNIDAEIANIERFQDLVYDNYFQTSANLNFNGDFWINFESQWALREARGIIQSTLFGLILFAFPIVIVSLFVANYSFGLIQKAITQHIGIFKTRGSSRLGIFLMLIVDFIITIILAVLVSIFVIGYPIASLILHTDNFLSFNAFPESSVVLYLGNLFRVLFIVGFLFGLIINFFRMNRLSKLTIAETENPVDKGEPYWRRHHLDIIFLFIGIIGYALFYISITEQLFFLGPFILLFLPSPILLVVGVILLFSRIFPPLLSIIGILIWERTGSLLGFALKNVIRHKQASTRAVMLIGVLTAFLVAFFVFPTTAIHWNQVSLEYRIGADAVGTISATNNQALNNTLLSILQTNYSEYFQVSPFLKLYLSGGNGEFLAVNSSSFQDTASFPVSPQTQNSLRNDMEELGKNQTNPGILIHEKEFSRRNIEFDENITIRGKQKIQQFTVVDNFKYFPRLYLYSWEGDNSLYGVLDLNLIADSNGNNGSLTNTIFDLQESGYYFNFNSGINQSEVVTWLTGNFSLQMEVVQDEQDQLMTNIGFLVTIGQLNANIIVSILIGVTVLLMFAFMQLRERQKEIFTERALGMKLIQLSALFLIESIVLLLSGLLIGNIMGSGLSWMFGLFITSGSSIPPLTLFFPWDLILQTELIILVLALIGAIVPAWIITKQDISGAFAGE